jgi:hypothetical protein
MIRPPLFPKRPFSLPILSRQFTTGTNSLSPLIYFTRFYLTYLFLARPLLFHATTPAKILPAGPRTFPHFILFN